MAGPHTDFCCKCIAVNDCGEGLLLDGLHVSENLASCVLHIRLDYEVQVVPRHLADGEAISHERPPSQCGIVMTQKGLVFSTKQQNTTVIRLWHIAFDSGPRCV